jgi:large subunit ribosomal protein L31
MKPGIHPVYKKATVSCVCGNSFTTRSTQGDIKLKYAQTAIRFSPESKNLLIQLVELRSSIRNTLKQ